MTDPQRQGSANRRENQETSRPGLFSPRFQKIDLLLRSKK